MGEYQGPTIFCTTMAIRLETLKSAYPFIRTSFDKSPPSPRKSRRKRRPPLTNSQALHLLSMVSLSLHLLLHLRANYVTFTSLSRMSNQEFENMDYIDADNDIAMSDPESDTKTQVSTLLGGAGRMSDDVAHTRIQRPVSGDKHLHCPHLVSSTSSRLLAGDRALDRMEQAPRCESGS